MGAHISVPMYRRSLPQRLRLEGGRCTACGAVEFPPRAACPRCRGALEPMRLSGHGQVVAATFITASGAPPEFADQARTTGGYWVGIVALAEGPQVAAQLVGFAGYGGAGGSQAAGGGATGSGATDPAPPAPAPGAPVRAVIRRLYTEDGVIRYGFKFQPEEAVQA